MIRQDKIKREEIVIDRPYENGYAVDGQLVLFEQYSLFRRTWKWVLLVAVLGTVFTAFYVIYMIPKEYMALVTALPPNKQGTPLDNLLGGVASSLKDFGLTKLVGGKSGENGYSRVALLTSRSVLDTLIGKFDLHSIYDIPREQKETMRLALQDNMEVEVSPEGPVSLSVYDVSPERAAKMANEAIRVTNVLAREMNRRETEPITKFIGDRYRSLRADQERITGEIRSFMSQSKLFDEKQISQIGQAMMNAQENVMAQRARLAMLTSTLGATDPQTIQAAELLVQLENESRRLAAGQAGVVKGLSIDNVPDAAVQYLLLRTDFEINAKVLAFLQPLYEQSQYDELRDIPVLQVLDYAEAPTKKARPRYTIVILSAFAGTFVVAYVVLAFFAYWKSFQRRYRIYSMSVSSNGNGAISHTRIETRSGEYLP